MRRRSRQPWNNGVQRLVLDRVKRQETNQQQAQEYRRVIQGLPAMVMTNGLGQALAFLMSDPKHVAKQAVVQDLQDMLSPLYAACIRINRTV